MEFDSSHPPDVLEPLFIENILSNVPLFGPEKANSESLIKTALQTPMQDAKLVVDEARRGVAPLDLKADSSVAEKLKALKVYSEEHIPRRKGSRDADARKQSKTAAEDEPSSPREEHDRFLDERMDSCGLPSEGHAVLDNIMLLRAKEMYLFDAVANQKIVADDPYLQDVWAWVAGESRPSLILNEPGQ